MEWSKFWAENKKVIDLRSKRFMAIDKDDHVKLTVSNAPDDTEHCYVSTEYLPKDSSFGKRLVRLSKNVILEKHDIEGVIVGEEIVLMRWGKLQRSSYFCSFSFL
jgi:glutamyl-tRNA synthetase